MSAFSTTPSAPSSQPAAKDIEVVGPPSDSISSLSFSPVADFLAVGSWDNQVRIYEVGANGESRGKVMYAHEAPVLDLCWQKDGSKVFSAGVDKAARAFDLASGQSVQVGLHDSPVKSCRWVDAPSGGYLVTGGWDKTLKYWDLRSPTPIYSVNLPDRCYSLDVVYPLMVVGMASQHIAIFDLHTPQRIHKSTTSPLNLQTRCIACFPSANGYAIGSIEGRVGVQYIEEKNNALNFMFKCHRKENKRGGSVNTDVFSVNSISFNNEFGTLATGGSDGFTCFWDKDNRARLTTLSSAPGPITATAFNRTSKFFAYAVSYDWSRGYSGMTAGISNKIMLHPIQQEEIRKKGLKK